REPTPPAATAGVPRRPRAEPARAGHPPSRRRGRVASHDHAADDLACLHGPDGVIDLVESDASGHEGTEVEAARLDEADEAREVAARVGGPVHAPEQALLVVEERPPRQG